MKDALYKYLGKVTYIYDGDTITCDIDLGLRTWTHSEKLRLARINAPELRGEEREAGLKARDFLRELLNDKEVFIHTEKDKTGKYGRYICEIWYEQNPGQWLNISDHLVEKGHARYQEY